jgi:hypothetical protein
MKRGSEASRASVDCVVLPSPPSRPMTIWWAKTAVLVFCLGVVAGVAGTRPLTFVKGTDFPHFYCAGRMVLDGRGHELYDAGVQYEYQAAYAGRMGTLYTHPPFEAALYLAVSWLPLRYAYFCWCILSLGLLAAASWFVSGNGVGGWDWRILCALSLSFVPALLSLIQGQDSILLLLLLILAFRNLREERWFAAGAWFALGLFKFQIVVPLALALVLSPSKIGKRAFAGGFGLVLAVLTGLSAAVSGWSVFRIYPSFLKNLRALPLAGFAPQAMANIRGLVYLLFQRDRSWWAITLVCILSAAALIKVLKDWKQVSQFGQEGSAKEEFYLAFANTVLFALLVSYHLNPQDLSLLVIPLFLLLQSARARGHWIWREWQLTAWVAILFLPPLHVWALRAGVYSLVAVPVAAIFLRPGRFTARTPEALRG